jgi:hypothetical protein
MPQWLAAIGCDAPKETVVNAHLGYASRLYRIPAGFEADWKAFFVQAAPPDRTRAGVLFPIEGGRWMVTLGGGDRDYPPTDEEGFLAFARSLPTPEFYEAIKEAEPLTPISGYRTTENRWRHYERMKRWPERLVVLGDGACAFNPVYGQGMTMAARGAQLLDQVLIKGRRGPDRLRGLGRAFQQRLARINGEPWLLATGEDYRYRGCEGAPPSRSLRLMHKYMDRIFVISTENSYVRQRFLEVQQMLKPPTTLFSPRVVGRVVWSLICLVVSNDGLGARRPLGRFGVRA